MSMRLRFMPLVPAIAAVVAVTLSGRTASPSQGDAKPSSAARTTADTRHLTLTTSAVPAAPGGRRILLNVDVALKPKMHVYAPDQPKDQDYMPIALTVAPGEGYRLEKPRYSPAEKFFFAPLKETQHVYSKPFRIAQPIVLTGDAPPELTITGTVRYQACDDAICYVPQTVAVKWVVPVSSDSRVPRASTGGQEIRSSRTAAMPVV